MAFESSISNLDDEFQDDFISRIEPSNDLCSNWPDPPYDPPSEEFLDWVNICWHTQYCQNITSQLQYVCYNSSILELWGYDFDYSSISKEDILEKVNQNNLIGHLGPIQLEKYMTPIRNSDGLIIGATALSLTWLGQANISEISDEDVTAAEDGQAVSFKTRRTIFTRCILASTCFFSERKLSINVIHFHC